MNLDHEAEADTTLSSVEKLLSSQIGLLQPIVNQSSPSSFSSLLEGAMNSQSYVPLHNVQYPAKKSERDFYFFKHLVREK